MMFIQRLVLFHKFVMFQQYWDVLLWYQFASVFAAFQYVSWEEITVWCNAVNKNISQFLVVAFMWICLSMTTKIQ